MTVRPPTSRPTAGRPCGPGTGSGETGSDWPLGLLGAGLMTVVQPPADLWMLAWVAPVPWILLAEEGSAGRRGLVPLWACGFLHWLAAIHWLRLPHPATAIGWVLLSAFLGLFLPAFVAVTRRLVHRWKVSPVAAAPLAWIGLDFARGTLLGGFTMASLGHTQWRWTTLLQSADLFGDVGVSGLVVLVAAGLAGSLPRGPGGGVAFGGRCRWRPLVAAGTCLAAAVLYGGWRMATLPEDAGRPLDLLLVQGSIDTELKHDPDAAERVLRHYDAITVEGLSADRGDGRGHAPPDLIVWPETMWRWGLLEIDPAERLPEEVVSAAVGADAAGEGGDAARQELARDVLEAQRLEAVAAYARRYGTNWVVGLDRQVITPEAASGARNYNSALFVDARGNVLGRYDKLHPVLFGEYVPFGDRFPWLYSLSPLPAGLTAGTEPVAVEVAGRRVAATICFETTLPEAVRGMVRSLAAAGRRPDVIVNLTNDGWFWGSSELDMHLACGIFRAVESRTPIAIAANTGLSASIDGAGRLLARGPRRAAEPVRTGVRTDGRWSPFLVWGGAPAAGCLAMVLFVLAEGSWSCRQGGLGSLGRRDRDGPREACSR